MTYLKHISPQTKNWRENINTLFRVLIMLYMPDFVRKISAKKS